MVQEQGSIVWVCNHKDKKLKGCHCQKKGVSVCTKEKKNLHLKKAEV